MRPTNGDRERAILLALIATFVLLVIGRILLGFFWVAALGAAVFIFAITFGFFLRIQRNRR